MIQKISSTCRKIYEKYVYSTDNEPSKMTVELI